MTTEPSSASRVDAPDDALDALVCAHLPLVRYAVAELSSRLPRHVARDDLVAAATLGLVQAARAWDPQRGVSFDRYARVRIRGALLDELRGRDWASRSVRAFARRARAASDTLVADLGRQPDAGELAAELGVDVEELGRLDDDLERARVLAWEAVEALPTTEASLPSEPDRPVEALLECETRGYLFDAVARLPERLRTVVVATFLEERPVAEVADDLGVSESRVSQMRSEATWLLRAALVAQLEDVPAAAVAPTGRTARRVAAYVASVGQASTYRDRLTPRPLEIVLDELALSA